MESAYFQRFLPLHTLAMTRFSSDKLCLDKQTNKEVLIRRTYKKDILTAGLKDHLDQELRIFSKADSRHFAKLVDHFQTEEYVYHVFEGRRKIIPLEDLIETELSEIEAKILIAQLLSCLYYLHKYGYYDSYFHPSHFMVYDDGLVRMTNLIHAKKCEGFRRRESSDIVPTHLRHIYMAPEVVDATGEYGYISDFWSLGIVIYQFFHDREPYTLNDMCYPTRLWAIIDYDDKNIPKHAFDLMKRLLRKPYDRLGKNSITDIKKNPYFSGVDWKFTDRKYYLELILSMKLHYRSHVVWKYSYVQHQDPISIRDLYIFDNFREFKPRYSDLNERILTLTSFRPDQIPKIQEWQPINLTLLDIWNTIPDY